jgi:hypothetical protein
MKEGNLRFEILDFKSKETPGTREKAGLEMSGVLSERNTPTASDD